MNTLPPMVDDLSAFIIAGRVKSRPGTVNETAARTPAQGVEDGIDAERLGFRRIFLSERWNLKEAAVILSAIGARTSRLELCTGLIAPAMRHPLHAAALGATMQAVHGNRFLLGLGRGDNGVFKGSGLKSFGFRAFEDYVDILRRLWRGEAVAYDGPAGCYENLALGDLHDGPAPPVWYGCFGLPKSADTAAKSFDGVLLIPNMTPAATAESVARLRAACERIGRDPASLRIAQSVITAPELEDIETRQLAHARAVTYLQAPGYGDALVKLNHWDPNVVRQLQQHRQFQGSGHIADAQFHRTDMLEPAALIPDQWMVDSCALGSIASCVNKLQQYKDAGADEIVTYGSTPAQNARLLKAWVAHKRKNNGENADAQPQY